MTAKSDIIKDTIVIAYPPGAYGTFLEWCFNYFTGQLPVGQQSYPFIAATGSAHRFKGNHFKRSQKPFDNELWLSDIDTYISSSHTVQFARTHADYYDMQEYINLYHGNVKKFLYIRPSRDRLLLILNNIMNKIPKNRLKEQSHVHTKEGMDTWEIRESISFWFNDHLVYADKYYKVNDNCLIIELNNLLFNLESTLDKIFDQLGLKWSTEHRADINNIIDQWLDLQMHINKDVLCQRIIDSVLSNEDFEWSDQNLSIYDEAYIQWALRDLHGHSLRCYNLNVFPTNTKKLRYFLINE